MTHLGEKLGVVAEADLNAPDVDQDCMSSP